VSPRAHGAATGAGGDEGVVLGVDIGTTSTKVVAFDVAGTDRGSRSLDYALDEPRPGEATQDPDRIRRAVHDGIRQVAAEAAEAGHRVRGLSFSAAMHSLLALDGDGRPLTPSLTWADTRATEQAERLRGTAEGLELHRRTGTPVHPMSPLVKLLWFRERSPEVYAAAARWVGIKEYVLADLTGRCVVDHGIASASGLLDSARLDWDEEALAATGVRRAQLPDLVPTTEVLPLRADVADELGLDRGTPVVAGGGDGPLANLGVGAVLPGVAACSIGTSGALRVTVEKPGIDPLGRVFCYLLTEGRWVVGGAVNNGGSVLRWAADALFPEVEGDAVPLMLHLAERVPPGSGGLLMLPYLMGERAPHWSALPRGAYVGLTRAHRREHLVRAALEGVCLQLALVLASMEAAGNEVREIRATGGFARSGLWRQVLSDALGRDLGFPAGHEGSSFGAALLGMSALGLVQDIEVAAGMIGVEDTTRPRPGAADTYRRLLPVFTELYDALVPTFAVLRELAPQLPAEPDP
jgi:gluconokinase